tara:strand:+ start:216 stop:548 length:333 start_codon:yes stop_codon:yes gene_type:complete
MPSYAKGNKAYGFCDKTGFRYKLSDLVYEYRDGTKTGFRVGRDVVDPDQPQNFLGRIRINDFQSLRDPRPDRFRESVSFKYPGLDGETLEPFNAPPGLSAVSGNVTIGIT